MDDATETKPDFRTGVPLADIPDGGMLAGVVGTEAVLLVRTDRSIRAYGATCTHLGAPLSKGLCAGGTIRCPWHHARFDLGTGEAVAAPAFDPLPAWTVVQTGDRVTVSGRVERPALQARRFEGHSEPGIVIVGGGAAGFAAAHELRARGHEGPVTLVSDEIAPPYDRTLLTKDYLDGKFGADRLPICATGLDRLGITFLGGATATALDRRTRHVDLTDGRRLPYTKLLLATGAEPKRLDVPGADLPHVRTLRSLEDARALMARLTVGTKVVVVGSSFIGLEAAASIRSRGFEVTVVTPDAEPLATIVGQALSRAIMSVHARNGVVFHTRSHLKAVTETCVEVQDGTRLAADIVVVGIGVTPRLTLAKTAGLRVHDGVVVDRFLRSSEPDILAAGDIALWPDCRSGRSIRVEHWVVAERQGQVAARTMMGEDTPYTDVPFFWSKHFDLSFRYVGHAEDWDDVVVDGDVDDGAAIVRLAKQGKTLAEITIGDDLEALRAEQRFEEERLAALPT